MNDIWTNDGGSGTVVWVGASYAGASTIFINGASGWGGSWVTGPFTATADKIAAAGYTYNKNQVTIGFVANGGSQVIFNNLTFTYMVLTKI